MTILPQLASPLKIHCRRFSLSECDSLPGVWRILLLTDDLHHRPPNNNIISSGISQDDTCPEGPYITCRIEGGQINRLDARLLYVPPIAGR